MIKKEKKLIIILIILIIVLAFVIYIGIYYKKNYSISDSRLKELYNNSYKYFLLTEGNITEISGNDGFILDNKSYTSLTEFENFKDIDKLIQETFSKAYRENYYNKIIENRELIELKNKLYYNNEMVASCNPLKTNYENLKIERITKDKISITSNYSSIIAYYEKDKWYLSEPLIYCDKTKKED